MADLRDDLRALVDLHGRQAIDAALAEIAEEKAAEVGVYNVHTLPEPIAPEPPPRPTPLQGLDRIIAEIEVLELWWRRDPRGFVESPEGQQHARDIGVFLANGHHADDPRWQSARLRAQAL